MPDPTLRPYKPTDRDTCAGLWEIVFGDPAALVTEFLRLFEHRPGFGMVADVNGTVAAAAYAIPGLTVLRPGQPDLPARYLYAVATHPGHRKQGLAAELCRVLRDQCFARGELLLTKPAEPGLYPWYEEKIGAVPVLPCHMVNVTTAVPGTVTPLSRTDYTARRETMLANTPHVRLPDALFQWEHLLHTHYGGGFFAVPGGIADVYAADGQMEIPELISRTPEQDAGALLAHFGIPAAAVVLPGGTEPYVSCTAPDILPDGLEQVWFGPVFG